MKYRISHSAPRKLRSIGFFLMAFWPRRGHNHGRIEAIKTPQAARVPCGSEPCRTYRPPSRSIPSTICRLSRPTPTNWCASRKAVTPVNQHTPAIASRLGRSKTCAGRSGEGRLQGLLDQHCDGINERLRLSTPGADFMDIKMDEVRIIALLRLIK